MYAFLEFVHQVLKEGITWATILSAFLAWHKWKSGREMKQINQEMRRDIKAIKRQLEVPEWDAAYLNGKNERSVTTGQMKKSSWARAAYVRVTIARYFTLLKAIFLSPQRRMNMKSKLLSRKFLMALATGTLIVLNDGLDMGLDSETIMYVVAIVGGWILGESGVDVARTRKEAKNAGSYDTEHSV